MRENKRDHTGWIFPVWLLAVLYIWFGSFYPFLFSDGEGPGLWMSLLYAGLLCTGAWLFRKKTVFRCFFVICRGVQILAILLFLGLEADQILLYAAIFALVPFAGLVRGGTVGYATVLLVCLVCILTAENVWERIIRKRT